MDTKTKGTDLSCLLFSYSWFPCKTTTNCQQETCKQTYFDYLHTYICIYANGL